MKIAYLDCFSGISGDMMLGALISLGWPEKEFRRLPEKIGLKNIRISLKKVLRQGIGGTKVDFSCPTPQPLRTLTDISSLLKVSTLSHDVIQKTMRTFTLLAEAESKVHNCSINEIHFHEIGCVDTILDIVGVFEALEFLKIDQVACSPLPVSAGWIKSDHGRLPLPAPATAELLNGIPVYMLSSDYELVTPTGAAIVRALTHTFSPMPEMKVLAVGYGAGAYDIASHPNLLRIWFGEADTFKAVPVVEIRTHIDDMNPEWYEYTMERLFAEGALDVAISPIQMKKNRPGCELIVICTPGKEEELSSILFQETTTSGVRLIKCHRYTLPRLTGVIETPWGDLEVKLITGPTGEKRMVPEYDACKKVASSHGIPLQKVYETVSLLPIERFQKREK